MLRRVVWYKLTDVSEVLTASILIALMLEVVCFSETLRRNPEQQKHRHLHRRENLKSHKKCL
jgi:hypothetical protein